MTTYLENYLASVNTLPGELRRNFNLMRSLDDNTQDLCARVKELVTKYAADRLALQADVPPEQLKEMQEELQEALLRSEEKVKLAQETYDIVDKHIRRLDEDLKKFENELKQEQELQQQQTQQVLKAKGKQKAHTPASRLRNMQEQEDSHIISADQPATATGYDLDMPIDPNEPIYCLCKHVSFGLMVACDNPKCPIEWFHYECVGLTAPPKGKWYCPDCTKSHNLKA